MLQWLSVIRRMSNPLLLLLPAPRQHQQFELLQRLCAWKRRLAWTATGLLLTLSASDQLSTSSAQVSAIRAAFMKTFFLVI